MCWPRIGEANPLFSVYSTLCRWTATSNFINAVKRQRNLGLRLTLYQHSFFFSATFHFWNNLPQFFRDSPSNCILKSRLKTHYNNPVKPPKYFSFNSRHRYLWTGPYVAPFFFLFFFKMLPPPPFFLTSTFFSYKQHFATFYVSLYDIYTINTIKQ
jgi:hypothetical protein